MKFASLAATAVALSASTALAGPGPERGGKPGKGPGKGHKNTLTEDKVEADIKTHQ